MNFSFDQKLENCPLCGSAKTSDYKKTYKGVQVKMPIVSETICKELNINEATLYRNLRDLVKFPGVNKETYLILRFKEGIKVKFNQDYYWIEDEK